MGKKGLLYIEWFLCMEQIAAFDENICLNAFKHEDLKIEENYHYF